MRVQKLDRVFDAEDVPVVVAVALIEQGRQVHFQIALEFGALLLGQQLIGHVLHSAGSQWLAVNWLGHALRP